MSDEIVKRVDDYIAESNWKTKENSNAVRSFANLQGYLVNEDIEEYGLQKVYTGEISQAHKDGFYHIHDMSHSVTGYCAGFSTSKIIEEGFNCGAAHIHSSPPHHLKSLLGQLCNFVFTMSGEWAGAQALNNFDTYCAPYIKHDGLSYDDVYKELRSFIHNLNVKTRIAMQSPFTNVSIDIVVPEDIRYNKAKIGEMEMEYTYGDCREEQLMFVKAFCQVMSEGDALGSILAYPIPTFCITEDFPWDTDIAEAIFKLASETGIPYFSNFVGTDRDPTAVRSMCPLTPDTKIRVKVDGEVKDICIGDLIDQSFEVYFNGEWKTANVNRSTKQNLVIIKDERGTIALGEYHQQVILRKKQTKTVKAREVQVGDYFIYDDDGIYNFSRIIESQNISIGRDDLLCVEVQ